ncbi:MAG: phosphoribosylanthranilate isomerase [Syntrophobacteria bacterium]|jgi:phosphoribosylanthranilate isomerase
MTVRIKICGITNKEDALAAAHLGADALGFVFAPSPRKISAESAREIIKVLPPFVQTVGVFVDEDPERVSSMAARCGLDILQLHGSESVDYCSSFDRRVIKAVRLQSRDELKNLSKYVNVVDALLLDTYVPNKPGGTGITFDWKLAVEARRYGRIVLAGGLNPENVAAAISMVKPYAVDASSGLEKRPGVKDHKKMAQFMSEAIQAARHLARLFHE